MVYFQGIHRWRRWRDVDSHLRTTDECPRDKSHLKRPDHALPSTYTKEGQSNERKKQKHDSDTNIEIILVPRVLLLGPPLCKVVHLTRPSQRSGSHFPGSSESAISSIAVAYLAFRTNSPSPTGFSLDLSGTTIVALTSMPFST